MFEIVSKDAAGRVGRWETGRGGIETPTIAVVVNPVVSTVTPEEIREMGFDLLITNSYILHESPSKEEILDAGIHDFLGWDGPLYTDSGAFQMYSQEEVDISPSETLNFQMEMGSDIVTPLDEFTLPTDDRETVREKLRKTDERYSDMDRDNGRLYAGPIQGGRFLDLRSEACQLVEKHDFDVHAIGGIVPLMEDYEYETLCDIIVTCKQNLSHDVPVHAFGAGHPMVFSLLAALGCDIFDSAMYARAARGGRYLTVNGTLELEDLTEFPCSCPECSQNTPRDVRDMDPEERERFLSLHNLRVTASELRTVRDAIRRGRLWELVARRSRAHPELYAALQHVLKEHEDYFQDLDPVTKPALFHTGPETADRPEIVRANNRLERVTGESPVETVFFGEIPLGVTGLYPMGQTVDTSSRPDEMPDPVESVRQTVDYLYGEGLGEMLGELEVETSRTGRPRHVYKDDELIGTLRASDGFFVPTLEGGRLLHDLLDYPGKRVVVEEEAVPFVTEGKSVFSGFVEECGDVYSGEEVLIVDKDDRLLATGRALLSRSEMVDMENGVAVTVRHYPQGE